ncbi:MAG: FG-GAP repeat protein, partial [Bryobacteraceae bacterium]
MNTFAKTILWGALCALANAAPKIVIQLPPAAADFNGDGASDLAASASHRSWVNGQEIQNSGAVIVMYGSLANGLTAAGSQTWSQESPGIPGNAEAGDLFGQALAWGDFNDDGKSDLAIGVPGEDNRTGVVHILYGSASGLTSAGT